MPHDFYGSDEDEDDECVEMSPKNGKLSSGRSKGSNNMPSKRPRQKGPMDTFFTPNLADVVNARKDQGRQKTMNELCRKELREKACRVIARSFYEAGVAFHGVTVDSFAIMCEFIVNMAWLKITLHV